ncbi:MAG: hypothetical protein ABFR63_04220, partial [Thermodesulfobacteriota bacterium]
EGIVVVLPMIVVESLKTEVRGVLQGARQVDFQEMDTLDVAISTLVIPNMDSIRGTKLFAELSVRCYRTQSFGRLVVGITENSGSAVILIADLNFPSFQHLVRKLSGESLVCQVPF